MAVTLSASLAITSNVPIVTNQPVHAVVSVTNSGSTATNVTGVQFIVNAACLLPSCEAAANTVSPVIPIGTPVQTVSGSTVTFTGDFVYFSAVSGAPANPSPLLAVYAIVTTSDGSVTVTPITNVGVATFLQQQVQVTPLVGQLAFDSPLNSALFPLFF